MNLYADTSGLATIVLSEPGAGELRRVVDVADDLASATIAYAELRSALAMAVRTGRIELDDRQAYRKAAEELWAAVNQVPVPEELIRRAGNLVDLFGLRAYNAVHLAALQASGEPGEITFICRDRALRRAAEALGYELLPAIL